MERSQDTNGQHIEHLPESMSELIQKPVFKLSPLMKRVEQAFAQPGETLPGLITRMHIAEGKYPLEISSELSINKNTSLRWIRKFIPEEKQWYLSNYQNMRGEIKRQLWQNPEFRAKRIADMKVFWSDPENKRYMHEKLHNPQSKARRTQSSKSHYLIHPEARVKQGEITESIFKEKRIQKLKNIVGEETKSVLEYMALVQAMPATEISKRLNLSVKIVRKLLKDNNIVTKPARTTPNFEILEERRKIIKEAVVNDNFTKLSIKEKQTLTHLYLLEKRFPTLTEIAKELKCTKGNINNNERRALRKLSRFAEIKT